MTDAFEFVVQLSDTYVLSGPNFDDFYVLDDHANRIPVSDMSADGPTGLLLALEGGLSPASAPYTVTYIRTTSSIKDPFDQELEDFGPMEVVLI